LRPGEVVAFHDLRGRRESWRVDAGGPVELHLIHADGRHERHLLEPSPRGGTAAVAVDPGCLRACRVAAGGVAALIRRVAGTSADIDIPEAAEILRRHPLHRAIILELAAG
jgi:predicted cupin superfamily sugar epimerase